MELKYLIFTFLFYTNLSLGQGLYSKIPVTPTDSNKINEINKIMGKGDISSGFVFYDQHDLLLLKMGYVYNGYQGISVSLMKNKNIHEMGIPNSFIKRGPSIGFDLVFHNRNLTFSPTLSYEVCLLLVAIKNSILCYTDFKNTSIKYRPEIGLSLSEYVNIMYGYNIAITNKNFIPIKHNLSVSIGLCMFSKLYKGYKGYPGSITTILEYPYKPRPKIKHKFFNL